MDEKFIIWDMLVLHGESEEETFKTVKKYFPNTSDEKIKRLMKEQLENNE